MGSAVAKTIARAVVALERLGATVQHDVHVRVYFPKYVRNAADQATAYRAVAALGRLEGLGHVAPMSERNGKRAGWHTRVADSAAVARACEEERERLRLQGV